MPPLPRSRKATSLIRLADYLEVECQQYVAGISWRHYKQYHDPTMPPMGFIETPTGTPDDQHNLDFLSGKTFYNLVLKISHEDMYESVLLAHDWLSILTESIMRKLTKTGVKESGDYSPFFQGIDLVQWYVNPDINQDNGATTILRLAYRWDDIGVASGMRVGNPII